MYEPTEYDIELLQAISEDGPIDAATLTKMFPRIEAVELRLKKLSQAKRYQMSDGSYGLADISSCYLLATREKPARYEITSFGKYTIQEFYATNRRKRREMWLKNAWIPILVAFITTIVTNALTALWPQIARWFASFLS